MDINAPITGGFDEPESDPTHALAETEIVQGQGKHCPDCRRYLPLDDFHRNGTGRQAYCKLCDRDRLATRRASGGVRVQDEISRQAAEQSKRLREQARIEAIKAAARRNRA